MNTPQINETTALNSRTYKLDKFVLSDDSDSSDDLSSDEWEGELNTVGDRRFSEELSELGDEGAPAVKTLNRLYCSNAVKETIKGVVLINGGLIGLAAAGYNI